MHSVLFPCLSFFIFLSCLQRTCSANSLLNSQQFPGYGQFPYQNNNNNGQQFGGFAQQQSFMPQGNPTNYLDDEVPARDKSALSQLSLSEIINRLLPCQVSGESVLVEPVVFKYHNYSSLTAFLQTFAAQYPGISRLYSAGKSTLKRELWVLEISNKPGVHQPGIPEFKYVGNMHGNEVIGREILLNLIETLLKNYDTVDCIKTVVDATRIHILPSMNPDGFEIAQMGDTEGLMGRPNYRGVDLNRNFPDQYGTRGENRVQEAETLAVMQWIKSYPFVLSANLHGGSLVANYPYDDLKNIYSTQGQYSESPDDSVFKQLAESYSLAHSSMYEGHPCPRYNRDEFFRDGITNGANWYPVAGGMQDWNYMNTNAFEITVELGCWKYPTEQYLPRFWDSNKRSLFSFLMEVHKGIKGFVTDDQNQSLSDVTIRVESINHNVYSVDPDGDYWRLLAPGEYRVTALKKGYTPVRRKVTIAIDAPALIVNFTLPLEQSAHVNTATSDDGGSDFDVNSPGHDSPSAAPDFLQQLPHYPSVIPPLDTTTKRDVGHSWAHGTAPHTEASTGVSGLIFLFLICSAVVMVAFFGLCLYHTNRNLAPFTISSTKLTTLNGSRGAGGVASRSGTIRGDDAAADPKRAVVIPVYGQERKSLLADDGNDD